MHTDARRPVIQLVRQEGWPYGEGSSGWGRGGGPRRDSRSCAGGEGEEGGVATTYRLTLMVPTSRCECVGVRCSYQEPGSLTRGHYG